jgi:hypothetical protein
MTITLEISPELKAELARLAAARGMEIDSYAARLLEEATHIPAAFSESKTPPAKDMVELFAPLRGLNLNFERDRDPGRDLDL